MVDDHGGTVALEVLDGQAGTGLDTVVTLAAACERAGLRPLLWVVEGHAFLGYWREDRSTEDAATTEDERGGHSAGASPVEEGRSRVTRPGSTGYTSSECSARTRCVARCSAQKDRSGIVPQTSVTRVNGRSQPARRESANALNRKIM